ncbi:MAG: substrate-binding domain-containing protein [Candidatus Thorarchaeota archaeon]|nr:MAG: substrate-binding domain-containing protein [Candidatus Thorarchaeota archaeon]
MKRERKTLAAIFVVCIVGITTGVVIYTGQTLGKSLLTVSTTTSLFDTGVLDTLKTEYEASHPDIILAFISAGTGIAITHAKNGDADLILVHSPSHEKAFMDEGFGVNRKILAYNFFTIVGPSEDPANISGVDASTALSRIYDYGQSLNSSIWVTRDDNSGTNSKEKQLWAAAGFDYETIKEADWLVSSGTGMGATLRMATELELYTLSDIGTYLKFFADGLIDLQQLVVPSESLLNVYSAIAVNASRVEGARFNLAMDFIAWLVDSSAQETIGNFGLEDYGQALFLPAVGVIESQTSNEIYGWIRSYAFFDYDGTLYECPPPWREGDYGLYQS